MPSTEHDAVLGKIIFTRNALSKMSKWGLYSYQIIETLKYGRFCRPIMQNRAETIRQKYYNCSGKQVQVMFTRRNADGQPIGGIMVLSCWT